MSKLIEGLFSDTIPGLSKALDLGWRRNQAITSNIANAETPGYRAVDLNFAGELDRAFNANPGEVVKTNAGHIDLEVNESSYIAPDLTGATKNDGNNVDIDLQMGRLAYNSGKYTSAATLMRRYLAVIKRTIQEGGR